jgi:hypothetical protein
MKITLSCLELKTLIIAISMWIWDLEQEEDELGALEEHQLFRRFHLQALAKRIDKKLIDKEGSQKPFQMKYSELEIFLLMNCYLEEEDELLILNLRSIMRKFNDKQSAHGHYILPPLHFQHR